MNNRWYDGDATLSMAVSLLRNASPTHQQMASRYILRLLEKDHILNRPGTPAFVEHIFPNSRSRNGFEHDSRLLLEVMKPLPPEHQQEMAVNLINYIYMLDCDAHYDAQAEFNQYSAPSEAAASE